MQDPVFDSKMESMAKASSEGDASANVTIYIGGSLIILGFLNGITEVPDAFIIGASLSGVCFTMVDIITLGKYSKNLIALFTLLGVISLFLLPIILLIFENSVLLAVFTMFSDMGTFYALGIVMIALGVKSSSAKKRFLIETADAVRILKNDNVEFGNEIDKYIIRQRELEKDYQILKKEYQSLIKDFREYEMIREKLMEELRAKTVNVEEEINDEGAQK